MSVEKRYDGHHCQKLLNYHRCSERKILKNITEYINVTLMIDAFGLANYSTYITIITLKEYKY